MSGCLEILGMGLNIGGTLLVMVACGLPTWKVSAHIEGNIVVAQTFWDGLWMSCVVQSTGQMQCKLHDSVLALSRDLQTARALTVISAVLGALGAALTVSGARCTNCVRTPSTKARAVMSGGALCVAAGLFVLVPVCWMANNIISDFYNPQVPHANKREIGSALYIGWAAAALMLLAGAALCCSGLQDGKAAYTVKYPISKSPVHNGDYDKRNYV
ncbi:claudin-5b [Colossoma macropomum]|uniref:claudin-5b n=1 Tax=Colossoma macropomum TaxID=42526 RepID=UPI0018641C89|nr:claudin-5b [Colossoma macropomum]